MASWYTPPPYKPIQYVPANEKDGIRAKEVTNILAAAHEREPEPYQGSLTNHWCLYLQNGQSGSVCIDNPPSGPKGTVVPGGSKAVLLVSLLSSPVSTNAQHVNYIRTSTGLTAGHVIDLLLQQGREKHELTAEGVGCRKWKLIR